MKTSRATPSRQRASTGAARTLREHHGYSMVELMVILVIIGILLIIGIPSLLGSRARSQDRAAQAQISSVYSVEKIIYSGHAAYTDIPAELTTEEPTFTYVASKTPITIGPVYVYLAPSDVIYVMAESSNGTCFYLRDPDGAGVAFGKSTACAAADTLTYGPSW